MIDSMHTKQKENFIIKAMKKMFELYPEASDIKFSFGQDDIFSYVNFEFITNGKFEFIKRTVLPEDYHKYN